MQFPLGPGFAIVLKTVAASQTQPCRRSNVGAAVTKFVAPFVLVAFGWQMVAVVWAAALVVMAVVF